MVSRLLARFFKSTLWIINARVQFAMFWLIFVATALYVWVDTSNPLIPIEDVPRAIVALAEGLIMGLAFKAFSFFLLSFLDFALVITPSVTLDFRLPPEKATVRLERTLSDHDTLHYSIVSFTLATWEQTLFWFLRNRLKVNLPYTVVAPKPFLVARVLEIRPSRSELRLAKRARAEGILTPTQATTHISILNEDTVPARSLAKVLETSLRLF